MARGTDRAPFLRQSTSLCANCAHDDHCDAPPIDLMRVEKDGLALEDIEHNRQTFELCLAAIRQNPEALRYVCYHDKEEYAALCLEAVVLSGSALRFVPESRQTEQICATAVASDPAAIEFVSLMFLTRELCERALKSNCMLFLVINRDYVCSDYAARVYHFAMQCARSAREHRAINEHYYTSKLRADRAFVAEIPTAVLGALPRVCLAAFYPADMMRAASAAMHNASTIFLIPYEQRTREIVLLHMLGVASISKKALRNLGRGGDTRRTYLDPDVMTEFSEIGAPLADHLVAVFELEAESRMKALVQRCAPALVKV